MLGMLRLIRIALIEDIEFVTLIYSTVADSIFIFLFIPALIFVVIKKESKNKNILSNYRILASIRSCIEITPARFLFL